MNNLTLKKKCPGVQGKLNWPGLYFSLMCIEPECLLSLIRYYFANVNLEAVASLYAILLSRASVLFIFVAFCEKNYLLYLNTIFSE